MAKRKKHEKKNKEEDSQEVCEVSREEKNQDNDKISSIQSEDVGSSNAESDSDDEMLLMASKWAKQKEDELQDIGSKRKPASLATTPYYPSNFTTSIKEKNVYSLHVTNLPYNATKPEIMRYFMKKGCEITSTRLVYNHHVSRGDRDAKKLLPKSGFTGVAFIDFVNEESYKKALKMDKEYWIDEHENSKDQGKKDGRGWRRRRINVRPTKTKEELAQIVENTKQRLTMARKGKADPEKHDANEKNSSKKRSHIDTVTETPSNKKRKINRKLTKKEKARKAAILKSKVT